MKNTKLLLLILILLPLLFTSSCDGEPLITELVENRVKVLLKGTLESDESAPVWAGGGPGVLYLDISEIRADGDRFANYRLVEKIPVNETNGFFNGKGLNYKSDDLYIDSTYKNIEVYIRKMGFNGTSPSSTTFYFDDEDVYGYDFNPMQLRVEGSTDTDDNLVFPLYVPVAGGIKYDGEGEWILEVRIVIKNNIRQYTTSGGITFWAIADNINTVTSSPAGYIGGNLASIAYAYKKGYTGTITIGGGSYQVAIPAEDDISEYVNGKIPPYISQTGVLENIPVGVPMKVYTTGSDQATIIKSGTYSSAGADVLLTVPGENANR
ncbi:MAG TPA: hypothetical protein PLA54_00780 [Spirochaetota bacterium]|nr:hypothetical protein [Spirochaetota bacterium]HQE57703.1 hypothetical protein [Spirochaetota bacterium]